MRKSHKLHGCGMLVDKKKLTDGRVWDVPMDVKFVLLIPSNEVTIELH